MNFLFLFRMNGKGSKQQRSSSFHPNEGSCAFRKYPPHRYYRVDDHSPDFLRQNVEYIHGKWPVVLPVEEPPTKLCVDQTAWHDRPSELPFADGTNPSLLSVERIRQHQQLFANESADVNNMRMPSGTVWVATACMTNSQCNWKDTPQQIKDYRLSTKEEPDTVQTVLLFLDEHYTRIGQFTIELVRDAKWGRRVKAETDERGNFKRKVVAFDDARLFLHQGKVWISYREGKGFGYESQVLNPLHIGERDVTVKASETASFCCGRNMALMENVENKNELLSLTWVDPVSVITVDTNSISSGSHRRNLKEQTRKSHIHGTNAFMVSLPETNEFIGMAHFHRPNDRNKNEYARFGHHYTHALFTISAQAPFHLTSITQEFILPSFHLPSDGEIIQFASGLERKADKLVIAYGINDCEAAVAEIDLTTIRSMLRPTEKGKEVIDLMKAL